MITYINIRNIPSCKKTMCFHITTIMNYLSRDYNIGIKSGDYEELKEKIHTRVLGNHSLLLQNVKEDKQGYYLCQASNGIGNAIGKVIQVNVKCKWAPQNMILGV